MRPAAQAMPVAGCFAVAGDHPSLPGHFPGTPVVPGVVLLDEAAALILSACPGLAPAGFGAVKFLRPARPGETIEVRCRQDGAAFPFACVRDGETLVTGTLLAGVPGRERA